MSEEQGQEFHGVRRAALVLAVLLLVGFVAGLAAGCGNLTAGGLGEVRVEIVGDGGGSGDGASGAAVVPGFGAPPSVGSLDVAENGNGGAYQGEVTVELQVYLRNDGGDWLEVTSGPELVQVDAAGTTAQEVARDLLPEGRYDRIRVEFHRAEVLVTSAPPGQGIPGDDGFVVVDFGGAPSLLVERPVDGLLNEAGLGLRVNLRARSWIRAAVLDRVPASAFRDAIQVVSIPPGG